MDAVVYFLTHLYIVESKNTTQNSKEIIDKIIKIPNCHLEKISEYIKILI